MFDDVQQGWLGGDDYARAVEAAGVVELPEPGEPESAETPEPDPLPESVSTGRWEDADPPGYPR